MALWTVYSVEHLGSHRRWTKLGRVRAKHQPDALLRAIKKFRIRDVAEQRKLAARPSKTPLHEAVA